MVFRVPFENNLLREDQQLEKVIENVKLAAQQEDEYESFYNWLITIAPNKEEAEIITKIRDETRKHYQFFKKMYKQFIGVELPDNPQSYISSESYLDSIKRALRFEIGATEGYKTLRNALSPMSPYRDELLNIIIDELNHADKFIYLFILNSTKETTMNKSTGQGRASLNLDYWISLVTPLVNRALEEEKKGINSEYLFQKFILSGVLVGLGKTTQEALEQVEQFAKSGESKLLAASKNTSKNNRGHRK